jgi:tetratricopeptide (TPR) repeat protein
LPEAYCNLGIYYWNIQDPDRCLQNFNKAIEIKPNYADALYNRGFIYCKLGNIDSINKVEHYKNAYDDLIKVININHHYIDAYHLLAELNISIEQYDLAINFYDCMIALDPTCSKTALNYYYLRGNVHEENKNYDAAILDYRKALEFTTNKQEAQDKLNILLASHGEPNVNSNENQIITWLNELGLQNTLDILMKTCLSVKDQVDTHNRLNRLIADRLEYNGKEDVIQKHPNLERYYRRLHNSLENLFTAIKILGSNLILIKISKKTAFTSRAITYIGTAVSSAPMVGTAPDIIASLISGAIESANQARRINALYQISKNYNDSELKKLASDLASILTERYSEQIIKIPNDTPSNKLEILNNIKTKNVIKYLKNKIKNINTKFKQSWLKQKKINLIDELASFAVSQILSYILNETIQVDQPILQQFLIAIARKPSSNLVTNIYNNLNYTDITTTDGLKWELEAIYWKPGIIVVDKDNKNKFFSGGETEPQLYGYRIGTEYEATIFRLISEQAEPINLSEALNELTAACNNIFTNLASSSAQAPNSILENNPNSSTYLFDEYSNTHIAMQNAENTGSLSNQHDNKHYRFFKATAENSQPPASEPTSLGDSQNSSCVLQFDEYRMP